MAFCNKCGTELAADDLFCPKCGNKTVIEEAVTSAPELPSMTKEESIALAEKLSAEYGALEKLKHEIDEAELMIKRPVPAAPRHAAFKFFWPFIIIGIVVYIIVYLIVGFAFAAGGSGSSGVAVAPGAAFVALGATLAIGGNFARSKRDKLNYLEEKRIGTLRGKMDELKKMTSELKTKYSVKKRSLAKYDAFIPEHQRTRSRMENIRILLDSGKADNFYEALKM